MTTLVKDPRARSTTFTEFLNLCALAIYFDARKDVAMDSEERKFLHDCVCDAENQARQLAGELWPNTEPEDWPLDGKGMLEVAARIDAGVI